MRCAMSNPRGLAIVVGLLAGCSVGPDFKRPAAPATEAYYTPEKETAPLPDSGQKQAPLPAQTLKPGADLPAQWWQVFKSPVLDATLKQSLTNSPTLVQATATLAQARE